MRWPYHFFHTEETFMWTFPKLRRLEFFPVVSNKRAFWAWLRNYKFLWCPIRETRFLKLELHRKTTVLRYRIRLRLQTTLTLFWRCKQQRRIKRDAVRRPFRQLRSSGSSSIASLKHRYPDKKSEGNHSVAFLGTGFARNSQYKRPSQLIGTTTSETIFVLNDDDGRNMDL